MGTVSEKSCQFQSLSCCGQFPVLDATSIDNSIPMIITVWLLQMQMSQRFLKQLRKHPSFEEDKMKVHS